MNSRNNKDAAVTAVQELKAAEALLLKGATVRQLVEAIGCSDKKARRIIDVLKRLGCEVVSDFELGQREAATFKMVRGSRLFRG